MGCIKTQISQLLEVRIYSGEATSGLDGGLKLEGEGREGGNSLLPWSPV